MNGKKRAVVLQDCKESLDECVEKLKGEFEITYSGDDGEAGLKEIERIKPDFLVTSLVLKNADGFEVLAETKKRSPETKCVVLSEFAGGDIIKRSIESGARYYMLKPVNYEMLVSRMRSMAGGEQDDKRKDKRSDGLDEKISRIFIGMGIPPHIKGYAYLREGVKLAVGDPELINSVTKKLYPMIGERYQTTASKVERAIRHAIEVAWNKGRIDAINSLFGVRAYSESEKPTNSEFIALIADRMLLDGVG